MLSKKERTRSWSSTSCEDVQICRFFIQNKCLRGDSCPFSHDLTVEAIDEPSCCDLEQPSHAAASATCGICLQSVLVEGRRFGLLPKCSHTFCLDCIKAWRNKSKCRKCPICRISSVFVIPSCRFFSFPDTKRRRIEEYLKFLSERPCIYYSATHLCPYGQLCFFKHQESEAHSLAAKVQLVYAEDPVAVWN